MLADCCISPFARLSRAAAKAGKDRLRRLGLLVETVDWARRAQICERCPMRILHRNVSYCGRPFLALPIRDDAIDGCGCPTRAKAKDPAEHCPVTRKLRPADASAGACDCKWCAASESP